MTPSCKKAALSTRVSWAADKGKSRVTFISVFVSSHFSFLLAVYRFCNRDRLSPVVVVGRSGLWAVRASSRAPDVLVREAGGPE